MVGDLDRWFMAAGLAGALLVWIPDAVYLEELVWIPLPSLGSAYAIPRVTPLAHVVLVLMLISPLGTVRHIVRLPRGRRVHLVAAASMVILGANDGLVGNGVYEAPFLIELSFLALVAAMAREAVQTIAAQATRLEHVAGHLQRLVDERTRALRETRDELQHSEQLAALGRLAAGVGHEINNPLMYVNGNLEALRYKVGRSDPESTSMIDDAIAGGERIAGIVRDLRVLAQKEQTEERLANVAEAVELVLTQTGCTADRGLELSVDVPAELAVVVSPQRLVQVLTNLVSNAVQAMQGARRRRLELLAHGLPDSVVLVVTDSGTGIAPDVLPHVFEPFFTTRAGQGTGLGLALVETLVRNAGGEIGVQSKPGAGASFSVTLRRVKPSATVGAPADASTTETDEAAARILVIDDDERVARMLRRSLSPHEVTAMSEPRDALALLCSEPKRFAVIVCDLAMPDLPGDELMRQAVAKCPELASRFLFMTAGAVTPATQAFLDQPGIVWLGKPVDLTELRREVGAILERAARPVAR
jgi:signal transduction histidine kinase/ActR/RegA family two-component response regulator